MTDLRAGWQDSVRRFGLLRSILLYGSLVAILPLAFIPFNAVRIPVFMGAVAIWLATVPRAVNRKARREMRNRLTMPDLPPDGVYPPGDGRKALTLEITGAFRAKNGYAIASVAPDPGSELLRPSLVGAIQEAMTKSTLVAGPTVPELVVGTPCESPEQLARAIQTASDQLAMPLNFSIDLLREGEIAEGQTVKTLIERLHDHRTRRTA
jgi:hypothetical protein